MPAYGPVADRLLIALAKRRYTTPNDEGGDSQFDQSPPSRSLREQPNGGDDHDRGHDETKPPRQHSSSWRSVGGPYEPQVEKDAPPRCRVLRRHVLNISQLLETAALAN